MYGVQNHEARIRLACGFHDGGLVGAVRGPVYGGARPPKRSRVSRKLQPLVAAWPKRPSRTVASLLGHGSRFSVRPWVPYLDDSSTQPAAGSVDSLALCSGTRSQDSVHHLSEGPGVLGSPYPESGGVSVSGTRTRMDSVACLRRPPMGRGRGGHGARVAESCVTLLLGRNINPKLVSEMLGHSSTAITLDTYSHVLPDMQDSTACAPEGALR